MKPGIWRVGWVLLGLLAIAAGMISLGESDSKANPAVDFYGPAGSAALFQLLDRQGVNPTVVRSLKGVERPGDVVLAFVPPPGTPGVASEPEKALQKFIRQGGRALILPYNEDYQNDSDKVKGQLSKVLGPNDLEFQATVGPEIYSITTNANFVASDWDSLWQSPDGDDYLAQMSRLGKGTSVVFSNGILATNRFIDQGDNAQILISTLAGLRGPTGRVLIYEGAFRDASDDGFLARIGPWAQSAWWQILVVFGVIIYSENRRFGVPERTRPPQRGLRELFDAVADTQKRSRDYRGALANYLQDAEARMRKALKLPREMSPGERSRVIPPELNLALLDAYTILSTTKSSQKDALIAAERIESALTSAIIQAQSTTRL